MKRQRILQLTSPGFILLLVLSLLSVSVMALVSPQAVMDLVGVQLPNTDAFSSIRGEYGGASLTLFISLFYLLRHNLRQGLGLLCLLWRFYALSRLITIYTEGALGALGTQWLITEGVFFGIAASLLYFSKKSVLLQNINEYGRRR